MSELPISDAKPRATTRRDALRFGLLGAGATVLAGCAPLANRLARHQTAAPPPGGDHHPTVRLLSRAGFGPRPGDIARTVQIGHAAWVDAALRAENPEEPRLQLQLARLDPLHADAVELEDIPRARVVEQLQQAAILRAAYGANPLFERMVEFWTDHFNIYALKGDAAFRKGMDDTRVIRDHALKDFPSLLRASAHSPAMLAYLDNEQNRSGHANENYARELMELHTLGVGGGYSQRDVQEVARCFTGWTIENRFLRPRGRFRFDEERHDNGEKTVLGERIPAGGGQRDGERVLEILAAHPNTARFVATKLVRRLLGTADPAWIDRTAATYLSTGGNVREMLRPLLLSDEFAHGAPVLKRPFDVVVSAIRALDADTDGGGALQAHLATMGQASYEWPMPDGYPVKTDAWTGSMLPRWNFAVALVGNQIAGTTVPASPESAFVRTHGRQPTGGDRALLDVLAHPGPDDAVALCLSAPSFQWT